jgi:hypothetical protein
MARHSLSNQQDFRFDDSECHLRQESLSSNFSNADLTVYVTPPKRCFMRSLAAGLNAARVLKGSGNNSFKKTDPVPP